jgi:outer membrane protein
MTAIFARCVGLAALAATLATPAAPAQTKVGIISLRQAMLDTAELKKAQSELENKFKPQSERRAKLQAEIAQLQNDLQKMAGKLTAQAEQEMTMTGQRRQRELQRLEEDLQADVDRERNDILTKAGQRMTEVLRKLAEEKGLDVVVDVSNTVYFKPALDLTKEATAAYDKAYPVK